VQSKKRNAVERKGECGNRIQQGLIKSESFGKLIVK
jgi:hypothetical protein